MLLINNTLHYYLVIGYCPRPQWEYYVIHTVDYLRKF